METTRGLMGEYRETEKQRNGFNLKKKEYEHETGNGTNVRQEGKIDQTVVFLILLLL